MEPGWRATEPAAGGAAAEVVALGGRLRRIELRGLLPVGWAGRLASGLASQRVNILRGWAREESGRWEAQLEVELPDSVALTPAVLLGLTAHGAEPLHGGLAGLEFLSHRVWESGGDLGDLVVEIEAADARGFLDRTLRLFALFGLFPREMQVETSDGLVHDLFRLRGLHRSLPEAPTVDALRARLQRLTLP